MTRLAQVSLVIGILGLVLGLANPKHPVHLSGAILFSAGLIALAILDSDKFK